MTQAEAQQQVFIYSLAHATEAFGWAQQKVLRTHNLDLLQIALLRRSGRHEKVSFDRIRHATGMPVHAITRAAKSLAGKKLGSVRAFRSDRRRRRFHISETGRNLLQTIELEIAKQVARDIQAFTTNSKRYYHFTISLWNLTRFLPDSRVAAPGIYHPTKIEVFETISPEQREIQRFENDLRNALNFDEPIQDPIID
jgi:DNA-binding MarR family transcriptional regulator